MSKYAIRLIILAVFATVLLVAADRPLLLIPLWAIGIAISFQARNPQRLKRLAEKRESDR